MKVKIVIVPQNEKEESECRKLAALLSSYPSLKRLGAKINVREISQGMKSGNCSLCGRGPLRGLGWVAHRRAHQRNDGKTPTLVLKGATA